MKPQTERSEIEETMEEGKDFWLGPIVKRHSIGDYDFIEYQEKTFGRDGQLTGRNCFSIYVNGKRTSHSSNSLDEALAQAIARKHAGCNTQAGWLFMKMIKD